MFPTEKGKHPVTTDAPIAVLVELESEEDARHLGRMLDHDDGYRAVETAAAADVCVVDTGALAARGTAIAERKREIYPEYLPILLLVPRGADRRNPLTGVPSAVATAVDDRIDAPVRKAELARRLDALARIHRLSANVAASRERYRELIGSLPEGVLVVRRGRVEYANDAAADLFGLDDRTDLVGQTLDEVATVTDGADTFEDAVERGLDEEFVQVTLDTGTPTGQIVEVHTTVGELEGEEARQVLLRDVTHHLRRERQLRIYRRAMDAATVGITIADASIPDVPLVYVNDEFCRLVGRNREEILGRNARFAQCPETSEETRRELREAIEAGESVHVEIRNERADGERWWNDLEVTPVHDDEGAVTHFVGFQRDVTERKRRKNRLERYETMVRTADTPIFAVNHDGTFRELNDAFASFVGESYEELVGADARSVIDESAYETYQRAVERLQNREKSATTTEVVSITNTEGAVRRFEVNVTLDPDGEGSIGLLHDVTEREERRQRLAVLDRVLRHNLRNKLNVILGHVEMLKREDENASVDRIESAARELLRLSDTARSFHRAFSRDATPHHVDLMTALADIVETVQERHPEATVSLTGPPSAEALVVDATLQAFDELIDNAIIHAESEEPTVRVAVERDGADVIVTIRDEAPPFPDHERRVIDGDVEQPLTHSSGISLWLSVWAIRRTGGGIGYDRIGDGNRLTVVLPTG